MNNNQLQLFNFKGMEFTVVLINDEPNWIAKEICDYLELSNPSVALQGLKEGTQKKYINGETLSQLKELPNFNLGSRTAELNLLTEAGVYKLIFKSRKPNAEDFTDWISERVLPSLRNKGKYDIVEEKLQTIKDEKEKNLSLTVYNLEQAVKSNPTDMLMMFTYNSKKQELETYKELKRIETENKKLINEVNTKVDELTEENKKLKEDTELIKQQQVYICNRTNFYERVTILANKYFGRDIQEAYKALYSKMKVLGSFDVYTRRKHEWEALNAERAKAGKKPYKESTLKSKFNMLDVIDKFNKWELCSEAYKTIETEMYNKAS